MDTVYFSKDNGHSGVDVTFVRSTQQIQLGGWYDSMAGIESHTMSLFEFL